jgi:drug/metabolite transporter (DMT)-like permease
MTRERVVRGRPASTVPADAAQRLAGGLGIDLAGDRDEQTRASRSEGLGALMGFASGVGLGICYGMVVQRLGRVSIPTAATGLTVAAMVGANGPAALAGVTDPREWGLEGWLSDVVPHVLYRLATAATHEVVP